MEQPNTDFGYVMTRQFFYDAFHYLLLSELKFSKDVQLAAIAKKAIKEVSYHLRFSSDWIRRLGDGSEESHNRVQIAVNDLWIFTDELFHQMEADKKMIEEGIGADVKALKKTYYNNISAVLKEATLEVPEMKYFRSGGKQGIHSEHMGYLLAELQYMQRTFPNMTW